MQSADFFCGIVPGSVLSQLGKAMNLEGAAGLAMKRLSREGLSWVPTAGNLCTLVAFGISLYINSYLTGKHAQGSSMSMLQHEDTKCSTAWPGWRMSRSRMRMCMAWCTQLIR